MLLKRARWPQAGTVLERQRSSGTCSKASLAPVPTSAYWAWPNRKKSFNNNPLPFSALESSLDHSNSRELGVNFSMKIVAARHFPSLGLALPVLA